MSRNGSPWECDNSECDNSVIACIDKVDAIHQAIRKLKIPFRNIKKFVRGTLGCQCPDDVFEKIEYGTEDRRMPSVRKIIIGNRLLIVIWRVSDPALIENRLPDLIRWGKEERDNLGLNRTRIVIGTEKGDRIKALTERLFGAIGAKDERIHLHVVDIASLPDEIEMT